MPGAGKQPGASPGVPMFATDRLPAPVTESVPDLLSGRVLIVVERNSIRAPVSVDPGARCFATRRPDRRSMFLQHVRGHEISRDREQQGNNDDIVELAEHGHEIRNEVDRTEQIGRRCPHTPARNRRCAGIADHVAIKHDFTLQDGERFHGICNRISAPGDGRFVFINAIIAQAMELFLKFSINAARRLPKLPAEHICSRVHGHTFDIEVHIDGDVDPATGWVIDFAELDQPVAGIKQSLEHRYLNEVPGLENPTSENLALWIWQRIDPAVPGLARIVIMEGHDRGCTYRGPVPAER